MSLAHLIEAVARRLPDHAAVSDPDGSITYARFFDRSARIAGHMTEAGLQEGDRVAMFMENAGAFFECLLACWIAGICAVPINAKLHPREMASLVKDSQTRLVFTNPKKAAEVGQALDEIGYAADVLAISTPAYERLQTAAPIAPRDIAIAAPAWLFYTSGTTAKPKGAILSHRNLLAMSQAYYADIDPIDERDTHLHFAPVSHASGIYAIPHMLKGSHQVVFPRFDVPEVLAAIARYPNAAMFAAPTMLNRIVQHPAAASADFTNLKTIYFGGAPMYVADLEAALALFGPKLSQIYGQGESPNTITVVPKRLYHSDAGIASPDVLASCGFARTGQEVKIVDEQGRDLPTGEIGEIITRSECVMQGYWNNPDATAKALRGGWLHTGDVGSLDARGLLTLRDRSKDLIISGGSNIYPREVEETLLRHEAVLEVSVIGRPHPDWGDEVVAIVAVKPGFTVTAQELDQVCLDNIARFKRPKDYHFVDSLPKNNYGKILKTELREMFGKKPAQRGAES